MREVNAWKGDELVEYKRCDKCGSGGNMKEEPLHHNQDGSFTCRDDSQDVDDA